jgi:hypothetical protein
MIWKMMHKLFGWEYVLLVLCDGDRVLRRAYQLGGHWWANPYLSETRTILNADGSTTGQCYVNCWMPITKIMQEYFKPNQPRDLGNEDNN